VLGVAVLAIAALAGPQLAAASTVTYAIVIGNNAPPIQGAAEQVRPLRYADDDAVRYFHLFSALGDAKLLSILDATTQRRYPGLAHVAEPPTLEGLRSAVSSYAIAMAADRQRGDSPVFYLAYSGHGARDKTGAAFLAMLDGPLTETVLYDEVLARLPAVYSHVVIDACHAGGVVGVRGDFFDKEDSAHTAPVTSGDVLPVLESQRSARLPHVGIILATTLGQESHEWSEIEAGVFSHEILSGMVGPADVNGDGEIAYSEIQAFVAAANRNIKDPRAIVHVIARPPSANQNVALISLATLARGRVLAGQFARLGHFQIELDNGQRYLDAHLAADMATTVVLPATGDAYLQTQTHEARIPLGQRIALGDLQWTSRRVEARGSIESAYRTSLFSSEYGRDYYRGYVDSIGVPGVQFAEPVQVAVAGPPPRPSRAFAITAASIAGASLVVSIVATSLAITAKHDFEATDLQRPAEAAKQRYDRDRVTAIAAGAVALGAGIAAYWLWPRTTTAIAPVWSGQGGYAISLLSRW
jgi:hypothetical protein